MDFFDLSQPALMSISLLNGEKDVYAALYEMIDSVCIGRTRIHLLR